MVCGDSTHGKEAKADSLIPGAGNPLVWDRYAYTLNAPTRYTDPSGHMQAVAAGSLILIIDENR